MDWFGNRFTTHKEKEEVDMATKMNFDTVPSMTAAERKIARDLVALYLDPYVSIEQISNTFGITKDAVFQLVYKARKFYGPDLIPRVGIRAGHKGNIPIGTQVGQRYDSPHPVGKRSGEVRVPEVDADPAAPPVVEKKGVPALLAELDECAALSDAVAIDIKNLVSELKYRLAPLYE